MSKWTDVRDNIVDALHVEDITEDVKQHVTNAIMSEVMPVIENAVDSFAQQPRSRQKRRRAGARSAMALCCRS